MGCTQYIVFLLGMYISQSIAVDSKMLLLDYNISSNFEVVPDSLGLNQDVS